MVNPITGPAGPDSTSPIPGATEAGPAAPAGGKDFKQILLDSLDEVNRLQQDADSSTRALLTGKTDNVAEVFAAVNKAGIAFDMLMEIRNKLLEAYREINQIRV